MLWVELVCAYLCAISLLLAFDITSVRGFGCLWYTLPLFLGFISDFLLLARILCRRALKHIVGFFVSPFDIFFNLFIIFFPGLAVWRRESTFFSSSSAYSRAWYYCWPMCSTSGFCCHWSLVCGNQGGYFLLFELFWVWLHPDKSSGLVKLDFSFQFALAEHSCTSHCDNSKCMCNDVCCNSRWISWF